MPLQQMALINFLYVHFKNDKKQTNPAITSLPKQRSGLSQPIMKDSITIQCYSNYYKIERKKKSYSRLPHKLSICEPATKFSGTSDS